MDYVPVPIVPQLLRAKVRVFAELHRKTEQLQSLNTRIMALQEEERRRIARELHDSVGQLLVAISMNNSAMESECAKSGPGSSRLLVENAAMITEVSKQIRTISYLLHPPLLEEAGLPAALRMYAEGFSRRSSIETRVEITPDFERQPYEIELGIFRLVQECLTNVHRHSGSNMAVIRVGQNGGSTRIEVQDRGKGFSCEAETAFELGLGLRGMRERLRLLGGTLTVESNGNGARIVSSVPTESFPPRQRSQDLPSRINHTPARNAQGQESVQPMAPPWGEPEPMV